MKALLVVAVALIAVVATNADPISLEEQQLLEKFLNDPAAPKTNADIWCLVVSDS